MVRSALRLVSTAALGLAVGATLATDSQTVLSKSYILFDEVCREIAVSVSPASAVYYDGSLEYKKDISHWVAPNTQYAACSFEPGTAEDVGIALRIIGRTRTPFAVKGGGHSTNPGFSSSQGIQIAMTRFSEVVYDPTTETATVGAGLVWDDVYEALEPHGRSVAGGRLSGVGVAGYTLGGGYSWITNQYGLTVDTVEAFELVTPNGISISVTESSNPDLFFALKGGGNNFGIVTRFTFKTFPQTQVWGGTLEYNPSHVDQVIQATANFAENNKDPKAAVIMSLNYREGPSAALWLVYDAPIRPTGVFDEFLAIPSEGEPVVRSLLSFVKSITPQTHSGTSRGVFNAVSTTNISVSLLETVVDQSKYWGEHLNGTLSHISFGVQPFLPTLFDFNRTSSAYPPDRTKPFFPLSFYFGWQSPESDEIMYDVSRACARRLTEHIIKAGHHGGQSDGSDPTVSPDIAVYPNYAIFETPLEDMYGANVPRLRAIHAEVDPQNVMGLAGGFKF